MSDIDDLETVAPQDQQEELSDLNLPPRWNYGAVLWSTDWTCETLIKQLTRGNIGLSPRFQRRQAWNTERQSTFVESLILGLPIPQLILAEDKSRRGAFIVIDGKQRLLSLRQFAAADEDPDGFVPLRLKGLNDRADLNGLSLADLQSNPALREDLTTFENQTIRTVVIRNWDSDLYLHSVFLRINTGSVQLSGQELRQALHPGPFSDFIDDLSISCGPLQSALKLKAPDFRMRDAELALRYFAYRLFASRYRGDLKAFLDETTFELNRDWSARSKEVTEVGAELGRALEAVRKVFSPRHELRKWNGANYERRINRAVFDIMVYFLQTKNQIAVFSQHGKAIEARFKDLCEKDGAFLSSIEATTKSLDANVTRFRAWAAALTEITGHQFRSPF